jgi:hypothetical protein
LEWQSEVANPLNPHAFHESSSVTFSSVNMMMMMMETILKIPSHVSSCLTGHGFWGLTLSSSRGTSNAGTVTTAKASNHRTRYVIAGVTTFRIGSSARNGGACRKVDGSIGPRDRYVKPVNLNCHLGTGNETNSRSTESHAEVWARIRVSVLQ